jgi:hypothetical protein
LDSLYPVHHLGDPGVDSRVLGVCAPNTPGDNSHLCALLGVAAVEQRTARVTLKNEKYIIIKYDTNTIQILHKYDTNTIKIQIPSG